ncbi:hypothetical protein Dsin_027549 [Dipteronia sinensis]|uniref:KIB1-4 beta-propeller domain-containing protein n=1 Tax=Dipteronia sinensis TaxID=43782 RepID=A0AAE0DTE3_9ROSI|nr:hypothetical protein Dsin_027549 [Dipteronia sinensis]
MLSQRKKRSPARWSDLTGELLYTVFAKLTNPLDVYRCGIVCVSWKTVVTTILPHFLLHSSNIYDIYAGNDNIFMFFNILTKKIHKMPVTKVKIPGRIISTSYFGWLLYVFLSSFKDGFYTIYRVRMLNPFSGQEIKLPSLRALDSPLKLRSITSTSPSDPNCLVLAFAANLIFCRPGDEDWTRIEGFLNACSDIIFYKGHFYVVNFDNDLFCIHCNDVPTSEKLPLQPIEFQRILIESRHRSYLVEIFYWSLDTSVLKYLGSRELSDFRFTI